MDGRPQTRVRTPPIRGLMESSTKINPHVPLGKFFTFVLYLLGGRTKFLPPIVYVKVGRRWALAHGYYNKDRNGKKRCLLSHSITIK